MVRKILLLLLLTILSGCATMPGTLTVNVSTTVEDTEFTCSYNVGRK